MIFIIFKFLNTIKILIAIIITKIELFDTTKYLELSLIVLLPNFNPINCNINVEKVAEHILGEDITKIFY